MTGKREMMPAKDKVFFLWSGGKDSALGLYRLLHGGQYEVRYLLTTLTEPQRRISMHGVREVLLHRQASALGIPLKTFSLPENAGMESYDVGLQQQLHAWAAEGITHAAFGDIFLEDLKQYRERQLAAAGIKGVFPLWREKSSEVIRAFLQAGFKAVVTSVNARLLDKSFAGRMLDETFIRDLPAGVDPCGENGEYHSFVFDGPIFQQPVAFSPGNVVEKEYPSSGNGAWDNRFFFCDLLP